MQLHYLMRQTLCHLVFLSFVGCFSTWNGFCVDDACLTDYALRLYLHSCLTKTFLAGNAHDLSFWQIRILDLIRVFLGREFFVCAAYLAGDVLRLNFSTIVFVNHLMAITIGHDGVNADHASIFLTSYFFPMGASCGDGEYLWMN